jgi:hypothetical protein
VATIPVWQDIGFERFLGPEIFFNPEICDEKFKTPLPVMVDNAIQACPIDARKPLYDNIVLSGGSSMFKDFGRRLQVRAAWGSRRRGRGGRGHAGGWLTDRRSPTARHKGMD